MAHCCKSGTAASSPYEPKGKSGALGPLQVYESGVSTLEHARNVLLLLPDGFGLALHNVILADRFAEAGWHVIVPDYFEGDPLPIGVLSGEVSLSFEKQPSSDTTAQRRLDVNLPAWLKRHDHARVSSLLTDLTTTLKTTCPDATLCGVGYCFGGKHVLRLAQSSLKAAVAFHPSEVVAEDLAGASVPVYVGLAEKDDMVPETLSQDFRTWSEKLLGPDVQFTLHVYSGMGHGFAARPNTQDDDVRGQYEKAFGDTIEFLARVRQ